MSAVKAGIIEKLLSAGARILESACGPCIGMGFAPCTRGISVRTFNRNFKGRSGTQDAGVYLVVVRGLPYRPLCSRCICRTSAVSFASAWARFDGSAPAQR